MAGTAFVDIMGDGTKGAVYVVEGGRVTGEAPFSVNGRGPGIEGLPDMPEKALLSLPLRMLNFRVLTLPFSDTGRARDVLPFELEDLVLGGTGSVIIDAVRIGGDAHKSSFLAVYVQKSLLASVLGSLGTRGVDPGAVTSLELRDALSKASAGGDGLIERLATGLTPPDDERQALALLELEQPTVNLRRGELAYTREAERTKKGVFIAAALIAAICLIVSADLFVRGASVNRHSSAIKNELTASYASLFPGQKPRSHKGLMYKLRAHVSELREKQSAFAGLSPLEELSVLSALDTQGVRFNEVTMDGELIVLKGEASSLSEVEKIKTALQPSYPEVNITETKKSTEDATLFTVTIRRAGQ